MNMRGVLAAAAAVLSCAPASAEIVSTYQMHVVGMREYKGALGPISLGQAMTVEFHYDYQKYPEGRQADHYTGLYHVGFGANSPVTAILNTGINVINMDSPSLGIHAQISEPGSDYWSQLVADEIFVEGQKTFFSVDAFAVGDGLFDSGLNPHVSFTFVPTIFLPGTITLSGPGDVHTQIVHLQLDSLVVVGDVPEPATWAMMVLGFGAIGLSARRRSKPSASFISGLHRELVASGLKCPSA